MCGIVLTTEATDRWSSFTMPRLVFRWIVCAVQVCTIELATTVILDIYCIMGCRRATYHGVTEPQLLIIAKLHHRNVIIG